eukprot:7563481-Pyramimonas_sp.AAC.1
MKGFGIIGASVRRIERPELGLLLELVRKTVRILQVLFAGAVGLLQPRARKELYEAPGGNLVDGLTPALYLVELFGEISEEEFGRRVELVDRPDLQRQC